MSRCMENAQAMVKERDANGYGDWIHGHRQIGRQWGALLSKWLDRDIPDVPPEVVCWMMVGLKASRACNTKVHLADHYIDAINYVRFAEDCADADFLTMEVKKGIPE